MVDCKLQQINVTDGSYLLAGEGIEWESPKSRTIGITPDTLSEVVFKLVCSGDQARPTADIRRYASGLERVLLPDPREQERIRKEKNIPHFDI